MGQEVCFKKINITAKIRSYGVGTTGGSMNSLETASPGGSSVGKTREDN